MAYEKQENAKLKKLSKKYSLSIQVGDKVKTFKGRVGTKGFRGTVVGYSKFRDFDGVKVLKRDKRVILCLAHNLVKC